MSQQDELLAWAASKLNQVQRDRMYGTVTFYLENGVITRSETKQQDKPCREKEQRYERG